MTRQQSTHQTPNMMEPSVSQTRLRLPNLIVIGVSKAGTSALFDYLGRHPEVGQSDVKEVRYFNALRRGEDLAPWTDYAEHFTGCDQPYAMEATPGYFYGGRTVATAMRDLCKPKVIVSLREPVSRCWSWYRFEKSRLRLPKQITFDQYLDRCFALHDLGRDSLPENAPHWGIGGGCYDTWMEQWIDVFGDDLKVVLFDDLIANPAAVVTRLLGWLDLDPQAADLTDLKAVNATAEYRNKVIQHAAVRINQRGEQFFRAHPRIKQTLRSGYYLLNRPKPTETMSVKDRERLEAFFSRHNYELAYQISRLGMSLPMTWAY